MEFCYYSTDVPANKKPAYYNPQVRTKIKDGETIYRVRGTIGGNQVQYSGKTAAHTASLPLIKILLNAVVSDPQARFMTADIKDFYLGTPLPQPEYMRIQLNHLPADIIEKHNMRQYADNHDAVIVEVKQRYLWLTAGWQIGPRPTRRSPRQTRIPSSITHTVPVQT